MSGVLQMSKDIIIFQATTQVAYFVSVSLFTKKQNHKLLHIVKKLTYQK